MPVTILNLVVSATVPDENGRSKVENAPSVSQKELPDRAYFEQLVRAVMAEQLEQIDQENER